MASAFHGPVAADVSALALRLDDVGAASKRHEVYSQWRIGNWLLLKYLPPFRAWGPYRELRSGEWESLFQLLADSGAKITVAVTAAWVESLDELIPYPAKFPEAAAALKGGVQAGLVEIANHGLTHCVMTPAALRPGWFSGNRRFHREFWDWVPAEVQEDHIRRSQDILQTWLGGEVVTFVPSGNVFSETTLEIAARYGLRYVSCQTAARPAGMGGPLVIGNEAVLPVHDRELVLFGLQWLRQKMEENRGRRFCFVRELGEAMLARAGDSR